MDLCNISRIRELLSRHGFRFSRSMGQNFLTASWVVERISEESGADSGSGILEVGPGIGCLTRKLAERAGKVVAVEKDAALKPVLEESLAGLRNVEVIFGDSLDLDLKRLVEERLPGLRPIVCANLPYNITSPLLTAFIEARCFESVTVMVQREVSMRVCAAPGTPEYGAFTVYANWNAVPSRLFDVSPGCFIPQPKVTSSVIRLIPRPVKPAEVRSEEIFFRVVRAAFGQRRKTLRNALSAGFPSYSRSQMEEIIKSCGLEPAIRGEELGIPEFAAIANLIEN